MSVVVAVRSSIDIAVRSLITTPFFRRRQRVPLLISVDGVTATIPSIGEVSRDSAWPRPPKSGFQLVLTPPNEKVLVRRVTIPQAATSDPKSLVELNLTSWTGFRPGEVYWSVALQPAQGTQQVAISVALVDAASIDLWRAAARHAGFHVSSLDLGLERGSGIHFSDPALSWGPTDRMLAVGAMIAWLFAAYVDMTARQQAIDHYGKVATAASANIADQSRLQTRLRAASEAARSSEQSFRGAFSQGLTRAANSLAEAGQLDEFNWEQGFVTLRLIARDPDAILSRVSAIAEASSVETLGGLEATMVDGANAYRTRLRYRPARAAP